MSAPGSRQPVIIVIVRLVSLIESRIASVEPVESMCAIIPVR
jgi:hypothetical protein